LGCGSIVTADVRTTQADHQKCVKPVLAREDDDSAASTINPAAARLRALYMLRIWEKSDAVKSKSAVAITTIDMLGLAHHILIDDLLSPF